MLAILIALAAVILARRSMANPTEADWLHRGSRKLVLRKATTYRGADLTGAVFADAVIGPSDYTDAVINAATFDGATVTAWRKVTPERWLDAARDEPS